MNTIIFSNVQKCLVVPLRRGGFELSFGGSLVLSSLILMSPASMLACGAVGEQIIQTQCSFFVFSKT